MDNPLGRVVTLVDRPDGMHAIVAVTAVACPRCAAGKGCGAGIMAAGSRERQIEARVRDGLRLRVDDVVELTLASETLLRAALIVYGLPLAGAIGAAALAWYNGLGDAGAALAALAGLGAGLLAGRVRLRRDSCLERFAPSVEAVR